MKLDVLAYDAVLFDLDGTLVDSMGMWEEIDIEYLARFNLKKPDNLQRKLEGLSFRETAVYFQDNFNIPDSVDAICRDWLAMADEKYMYKVKLKPGAYEFLTYLKDHGISTAIASSNHTDLIDDCLKAHHIDHMIDVVITCDDVVAGKPDPSVYLACAERLRLTPDRCLVFEDIPCGIEAGKNAGMTVCAIWDSYSDSVSAKKEELSDACIRDYFELIP